MLQNLPKSVNRVQICCTGLNEVILTDSSSLVHSQFANSQRAKSILSADSANVCKCQDSVLGTNASFFAVGDSIRHRAAITA